MNQDVRALEAHYIVPIYRRTPIVLVRGAGARVFDDEGREYLDLIAGLGVCALGHGHERLTDAIAAQARELIHCSNLFFHPLQGQLAERLVQLSGLSRAFFCNSGTEAVEACLKFARRYWHAHGATERREIVALEGSFHGRTFGSLSVTFDEHYRAPFAPLLTDVRFVPSNDSARLKAAVSAKTAAVIIEPIQGEGGVRPLLPEYARTIAEVCEASGALLIADEVQCGLGRTGAIFRFRELGLEPHLVALGKALGAGVPIGAALVREEVALALSPGDHGSTFGGNLLACRAALVFLEELTSGLLDHVARMGTHLEGLLRDIKTRYPAIVDVRGAGLMWGVELNTDATPVFEAAVRQGLLVNRTAVNVIRLLPPLTITQHELDRAAVLLDNALTEVLAGVTT